MSLQTVTVISDTCVRCGGASGPEVIPGDAVLLWLDQASVPAFPESVPGVVTIVEPQTVSSTAPKHYTVQYDDADLDGAAALLRDCDVLSVTCESCCDLINTYLDDMAGVNIPFVSLGFFWNDDSSDGSFTLQADAGSNQMAGSPSAQVTIVSYVFTDSDATVIAGAANDLDRIVTPTTGWIGELYTVTVTDSEGLTNTASVWVEPRPGVFPTVAPTIASAGTIGPVTQNFFVSGVTQINTITAPDPIAAKGGQIVIIPTGVFTTSTSGNIALASTAVVGKALIMTYDAGTSKFYPSY